ncbi:hypothetical protein GCM10010388_00040 [Streptomyces mauvecolor]
MSGRRLGAVADLKNSAGFKAPLARAEAELHTRGLGIQPRSALRYIDPAMLRLLSSMASTVR